MEINKQLFEDILSGKLKGRFVLRDGETYKSEYLCSKMIQNRVREKVRKTYNLRFEVYS